MSSPDMALPPGKKCSDCVHFERCRRLVGAKPLWSSCDWRPSRFRAQQLLNNQEVQQRQGVSDGNGLAE